MVKLYNYASSIYGLTLTLLLFSHSLSAGYRYNPNVDRETWDALKPYFLPDNHVIKEELDDIFKKERVIESRDTLRDAHFRILSEDTGSHMYVLRHKDIEGYLFKVYTDYGTGIDDAQKWLKRIQGAEAIRNYLKQTDYDLFFKVSRKWVYPLSQNPPPDPALTGKHFILVVEDMHLLDSKKSKKLWDSDVVHYDMLDALYEIITELGLARSTIPDNIPFSEDGKIVFIDTEVNNTWPIDYEGLNKYLSSDMKSYWKKIIKPKKH